MATAARSAAGSRDQLLVQDTSWPGDQRCRAGSWRATSPCRRGDEQLAAAGTRGPGPRGLPRGGRRPAHAMVDHYRAWPQHGGPAHGGT
ncbi:hypothetical protein QJS66_16265 [Kocuria rhizophila]|nr:hypothetical protein QJS66_16265 [Kocuria rhizophila]